MRFCPKCRSYYDDADIRFCLNDGVPLAEIGEGDERWTEGSVKIRRTKHLARRNIIRRQLIRVISILITTILTVLIISVVTINSWIYFNPLDDEMVYNQDPSPSREPTIEVQPSPAVAEPAKPSPTATITPTPTPTPNETDKPPVCRTDEKAAAKSQILATYAKGWREKFALDRESVKASRISDLQKECDKMKAPAACSDFVKNTAAELGEPAKSQSVSLSADCQTATATVAYEWNLITPQFPPAAIVRTKRFLYRRQGNGWQFVRVF